MLVNYWSQNQFQTTDGIIGLSLTYYGAGGSSSGPTIISNLFDSGVINDKVFAVHFDSFGGSTVQFGGYDPQKIIPNVPLTYFETAYVPTW